MRKAWEFLSERELKRESACCNSIVTRRKIDISRFVTGDEALSKRIERSLSNLRLRVPH
jgi:hypothetical protein